MKNFRLFGLIITAALALPSVAKTTYVELVKSAQLTEVAETISTTQINQDLPLTIQKTFNKSNAQAALLLSKLNCLDVTIITDIYVNDKTKSCTKLNSLTLVHPQVDASLQTLLNTMLLKGIFEGYNIKKQHNVTSSKTAKELLLYGHQNLVHAKQLLSLLSLHNVEYTWRLIPKTSSFKIREGWGDANTSEKKEKVRSADEYDLQITFVSPEQKLKFMPLINKFAKRNTKAQKGLIAHAWWQPFYRGFKAQKNYQQVKRISFTSAANVGSTLVLNENYKSVFKRISAHLTKQKSEVALSTENVWVNPSFYRYLQGEFK